MRLMTEAAAEEIVPRFGRLGAGEVQDKGRPWDLVTVADVVVESRLTAALSRLVPGSRVVGEEAAAADSTLVAVLEEAAPVWLIDPVDGTSNFVQGQPCFAVVVAYSEGGETRAGWILDPLANTIVWAEAGEGAFLSAPHGERRLWLTPERPLTPLTAAVPCRVKRKLQAVQARGVSGLPVRFVRLGSAGREYMGLATGSIHFALYHRLKPWDHAAGVLIHSEAGGFGRLREGARRYRPAEGIVEATLLLAPTAATWSTLDGFVDC